MTKRSILIIGLVLPASAEPAPQWGQAWTRNMVSAETGLAERFDVKTGENIRWRARLGTEAHSSPVVAGGRVLIGTNNGQPRDSKHIGDRGVLMCFDERTGRLVWQLVVPKRSEDQYFDWPNSGISSPATVEGDRVFTVTNRGEVVCLDLAGLANGNDGPFKDEGRHMMPAGEPAAKPGRPRCRHPLAPRFDQRRGHLVARCRAHIDPHSRPASLPEYRHRRRQHSSRHPDAGRPKPRRRRESNRPPPGART